MELEIIRRDKKQRTIEAAITEMNIEGITHYQASVIDITDRKRLEHRRDEIIQQLNAMLGSKKVNYGIPVMCANCHQLRADDGNFIDITQYLMKEYRISVSHTICPNCLKILYPDVEME